MKGISKNIGAILVAGLIVVGCGGGGSTTTAVSGTTYTGVTTAAPVTSANADSLASTVATGSSGGSALAATGVVGGGSGLNYIDLIGTVIAHSAVVQNNIEPVVATGAVQAINQTINGADFGGSGSMTMVGSIDDVTFYGSITMTMNQFNDGTTTMNGVMIMEMNAAGMSLSFSNMTVVDITGSYAMDGSIQVATTATGEVATMNFVGADSTGFQVKLESFVLTTTLDLAGAVTSESMSGRIYDSTQGYLDIITTSPMVYSPAGSMYPSSGGPITATGANGTKVRVTAIDATNALVEADTIGDGNYDYSNTVAWSTL